MFLSNSNLSQYLEVTLTIFGNTSHLILDTMPVKNETESIVFQDPSESQEPELQLNDDESNEIKDSAQGANDQSDPEPQVIDLPTEKDQTCGRAIGMAQTEEVVNICIVILTSVNVDCFRQLKNEIFTV